MSSLTTPGWKRLRRACGEDEWAKAGFAHLEGLAYGLRQDGLMVAAGNMTDYRGVPADVGVSHAPCVPRPWFSPTIGLADDGRAVAHWPG